MSQNTKFSVYIGTSGWSYSHWKGPFYPHNTSHEKMLECYQRYFDSVEINSTFYKLPPASTLQEWRNAVPKDFIFSVKASRFITHMKKLKEPEKATATFLHRVGILGDGLGPVLFQLPPHWKFNQERLSQFLQSLSHHYRYAIEFRDRSWINTRTLDLLAKHNAAFCIYELDGYLTPIEITSDFIYIRLHGPNGSYQGDYSHATLTRWANAIAGWKKQGYAVFCYFDNDQAGYAPNNAMTLRALLKTTD